MIKLELDNEIEKLLEIFYKRDNGRKYPHYIKSSDMKNFQQSSTYTEDDNQKAIKAYETRLMKKFQKLYYNEKIFKNNKKLLVCPICNINSIPMYIENEKIYYKCQFDHIIPKSNTKYTHLVNNFYNIIPICSTCNHIKLDKNDDFFNPFLDHSLPQFKFMTSTNSLENYVLYNKFSMELEESNIKKYNAWIEAVNLKKRLEVYSSVIQERLDIISNNSQKDKLLRMLTPSGNVEGNYNKEINQLVFNMLIPHFTEEDYMCIPFSKIITDIIEQYKEYLK